MSEKLCIFCTKFHWAKESMWGMGSTMTGPMMEGGDITCDDGHLKAPSGIPGWNYDPVPQDEDDWRRIIVQAQNCPDYDQVKV